MDVMEDFQTHVWPHWWEARTQADTWPPHSKDESQVFVLSRGLPVSCQVGISHQVTSQIHVLGVPRVNPLDCHSVVRTRVGDGICRGNTSWSLWDTRTFGIPDQDSDKQQPLISKCF